jgi:hypothetical protein
VSPFLECVDNAVLQTFSTLERRDTPIPIRDLGEYAVHNLATDLRFHLVKADFSTVAEVVQFRALLENAVCSQVVKVGR